MRNPHRSSRQRNGEDWRDQAACRGMDTNLFFPVGAAGAGWVEISEAKKVCSTCPVQAQCLRWAADVGVDYGIWGGLTDAERRSARRRPAHRLR